MTFGASASLGKPRPLTVPDIIGMTIVGDPAAGSVTKFSPDGPQRRHTRQMELTKAAVLKQPIHMRVAANASRSWQPKHITEGYDPCTVG
jgi:hypothetical protein